MTNLPEASEPRNDIGLKQLSMEVVTSPPEAQLLRHRAFDCWQIGVVAIFTGFLGGGSLIAINLCILGHRVLAAIVFIPIACVSLFSFFQTQATRAGTSAELGRFWVPALLAYWLARALFRSQYAPFKKPFAKLSTLPNGLTPLWYAFMCALGSWIVALAFSLVMALCLDVVELMSDNPTSGDNRAGSKAPALEEDGNRESRIPSNGK